PSGLAAADLLNRRGHNVTVFEREDRIGGLLMYGIPNMKLEKQIILRRQALMEAEGVVFRTGCNVGADVSAEELLKEYDAVVLCCGSKEPRRLNVGEDAIGNVFPAVEFLTQTTKALLKHDADPEAFQKDHRHVSARNKNVIIVGGGDTGNDCVGTCLREGCASVTQLEMMPQPPKERPASNPWPEWPVQLKTDYGQEEAIAVFGKDPRVYQTTIKEVIPDKKGNIKAVKTVKLDASLKEVEGSEEMMDCDLLLIAAGFTGCESYTAKAFGVELTNRNVVKTDAGAYASSTDKVFVAGDMHRGQSLVVWAIAEGRACAVDVDRYLMGYTNLA
ncbi:MAG: glutamate synthase subunit beta, partial [Clostridia bacterium]|nr:glutamate synthase subunit beta [Clostridia bacterium]